MSNTFTQTFGGNTLFPSEFSYQSLSIGSSVSLSWPLDSATTDTTLSSIMEVSASTPGLQIKLPAADAATPGLGTLFVNIGANDFFVIDAAGGAVATIGAGTAWYVYLTANGSPAGVWRTFRFGAFTSVAQAAALAGPGIRAIGSVLGQTMPVWNFAANYALGIGDRAKALVWTGGAGTLTLASAASLGADYFVHVKNAGTGSLTLAPSGLDTINGAESLVFDINDGAIVVTDGVRWYTIGFSGTSSATPFNFQSINIAGVQGNYVLPTNAYNKVAYRFFGALAGSTMLVVPATVQEYWIDNSTTGASFTVGVAGQVTPVTINSGSRAILYCDGVQVVNAATQGIATPLAVNQGGTGATTAAAALVNLGGTTTGISVFTAPNQQTALTAIGAVSLTDSVAFAVALG